MNRTFKTVAFGCRVNIAEDEEIQKQMLSKGFVWRDEKPDVFIINTCAVTDKAEREARQLIYHVKRESPHTLIVATGCATTNWQKQSLLKTLPIDIAVDNINKQFLVEMIAKKLSVKRVKRATNASVLPNKFSQSGRYLLKIQDGCHRFCTFCIVPYLRGRPISVPTGEIINRINQLPSSIKEVILTAINTEAFGKDTGEDFLGLVEQVLAKTKIRRLSFGSIHPWSITKDFLDFYQQEVSSRNGLSGRLADFFHIPLQSGSDKMLTLMKRNYQRSEMMEKLRRIQQINPYALIGTDVIVGFLNETTKDFNDTYKFLETSPIAKFHAFRFSRKKGTAAYFMAKNATESTSEEKRRRSQALISLGRKKYRQFQESLVGKTFKCLFINRIDDSHWNGLLSNQMPIVVAGANNPRSLMPVRVERLHNGVLQGDERS